MGKTLEEKYEELEKRVAVLEKTVQVQPKKFIPEYSEHGLINNTKNMRCPTNKS